MLLSLQTKSKEAWEYANKRICCKLSGSVGWKTIFALFSVLRIFFYFKNVKVSNSSTPKPGPTLAKCLRSDTELKHSWISSGLRTKHDSCWLEKQLLLFLHSEGSWSETPTSSCQHQERCYFLGTREFASSHFRELSGDKNV